MFFDDPRVAFRNVARAMRASARLGLMVWQVHDRNEWAVSIDRALGRPQGNRFPAPTHSHSASQRWFGVCRHRLASPPSP
jgi:hypothetical protein